VDPSRADHQVLWDAVAEDAALYSLGLLDGRQRKQFEARLNAQCPLCQAETAACSGTLGEVAAASLAAGSAPPPRLRDRLLAMAQGQIETGRDMLVVRGGAEGWTPGTVPGTMFKPLEGGRTYLLKMDPGSTLPTHEHSAGGERCLLLEGSARAAGVDLYQGDFIAMPRDSHHEEFSSAAGCTLLIFYS